MRRILHLVLAISLLVPTQAQASVPSKQAAAVRQQAAHLTPGAHISVLPFDTREAYGRFVAGDLDGFTFYDIDEKTNVTLKYDAVRKIKNGYGGYNFAVHRHTDQRQGLIVALVVAGVLAALIGAAATLK